MRRSARGQIVLRTVAGCELERIAAHRDVRSGLAAAALEVDGGGDIDTVLARRAPAVQVSRAFVSRRGLDLAPGEGHLDWDDLEHELGLSRTFRIDVDPETPLRPLVEDLAALAHVELASPAFVCATPFAAPAPATPHPSRYRELIGADRALDLEPGDSALIVALVDSGVDHDHPELDGRLRPGMSSVSLRSEILEGDLRVLSGAHARLQDVSDDEGHGTGCAGLLAANGFRIGRGLCGAGRLLPIRALCGALAPSARRPTAIGLIPDIDSGLKTAIDLGARILNLSFGTAEDELEGGPVPHVEVVRYAIARDCILVAASGNTGRAGRFFPAALPGVIAVGAVDDELRPATFTTRGEHVALSAPGVRIASAGIDGYAEHSGTSFAAPLVTGACALLVARAARHSRPLGPETLRAVLVGAVQRFAAGADTAGCGAGVLDVPAALAAVDALCRDEEETARAA